MSAGGRRVPGAEAEGPEHTAQGCQLLDLAQELSQPVGLDESQRGEIEDGPLEHEEEQDRRGGRLRNRTEPLLRKENASHEYETGQRRSTQHPCPVRRTELENPA